MNWLQVAASMTNTAQLPSLPTLGGHAPACAASACPGKGTRKCLQPQRAPSFLAHTELVLCFPVLQHLETASLPTRGCGNGDLQLKGSHGHLEYSTVTALAQREEIKGEGNRDRRTGTQINSLPGGGCAHVFSCE